MKKVVITGPTGVIGRALIDECLKHGIEVTAVCRKNSNRAFALLQLKNVHVVECDLRELLLLPELLTESDYDTFYHLGWDGTFGDSRNCLSVQTNNIRYTLDAVDVAQRLGCSRFIGAGSQAEYGRVEGILKPDTPVKPENGYGMAKLCAGQMSRLACEQRQMEHIWTRVLSVYGPEDGPNTMISSVITSLLLKKEPELTKGEQKWDYLYSADAGRAFYLLGENGISGKVYPIGSGKARPLAEYVKLLRDAIDPGLPLGFGKREYAKGQVMHLCADISELQGDTGFVPAYSFEEGIQKTINWWRQKEKKV